MKNKTECEEQNEMIDTTINNNHMKELVMKKWMRINEMITN